MILPEMPRALLLDMPLRSYCIPCCLGLGRKDSKRMCSEACKSVSWNKQLLTVVSAVLIILTSCSNSPSNSFLCKAYSSSGREAIVIIFIITQRAKGWCGGETGTYLRPSMSSGLWSELLEVQLRARDLKETVAADFLVHMGIDISFLWLFSKV